MSGENANTENLKVDIGSWIFRGAFLVLAVAVMIGSLSYGLRDENGLVAAGMMPFAASLVMIIATLWEASMEYRRQRLVRSPLIAKNAIEEADELEKNAHNAKDTRKAVVTVFMVILAAILFARVVGLLIALSVMVVVLIWPVERKPWWVGVLGGVGAFLFGYVVFSLVLEVPLPTGMLGLV
ncbi:MAG: tripartite tricarboxylate transporter TctB family protein [Actinomycetaceae bacterium]|nr:tripartite tricarboxylate transporter TctB family protein [Actinomycetaceae bacterium]MDY5272536.1 tripartite tricarboxylate transporter TctB family protein [Arcanobacterium sp.]